MLDYHLHLWPHNHTETPLSLDQLAAYCDKAQAAGVVEVAVTEHLFRFVQAAELLGPFWEEDETSLVLQSSMADYWDHHARADLDAYVDCALEAQAAGLPIVVGLEVDHYRGRMDKVGELLDGYPFDVLLGSVHWVGAWRFDDLGDEISMAEWSVRDIDRCWDEYTEAIEELAASGACDVLAHPDLVKAAGHRPAAPDEWWDRLAEAAASSGMAAEVSSAGWRKPADEAYPAKPLLDRFVARGVPLTTASDAHHLELVADRSAELRAMLGAAGVGELRAYRARRPHPVPVGQPLAAQD
ncbi:MAG TPA: histidinol-phosphatase [Acidimicrobiales bacterium]|nr:histidinol-phosphatase [Acidimicrobiales bacterium]